MSNYRLTVRRRLALAVPGIVLLLFVTFGVRAQSQASTCPAGQYCSVTFDGTRYTVLGPCDLSSLSAMANGCLIVGSNPLPGLGGGGPLLVTGFNPGASIVQDYPTATSHESHAAFVLQEEALQHIADLRGVANDTVNAYWSRGEVRAYMYLRLLQLAGADAATRTDDEKDVVAYYTNAINEERQTLANKAIQLYNTWHASPCGFHVPIPGHENDYLDTISGFCVPTFHCPIGLDCTPSPPSAEKFTAWAEGALYEENLEKWAAVLADNTIVDLHQPLSTECGAASDCADARKAAAAEYDAAFGDILEGIDYLTAKQEQVATVANAARTAAESDTAELISDVLRDMAKDRITDLMVKSVSTVFMGFFEEAGAATLSSIFGSGDALAIALAEEGVGVLAEAWDNIIGPAVAAAVIIAYETYLVVTDAQVPEKLSAAQADAYHANGDSSKAPYDLKHYAQTSDATRQLVLTALIRSTMPDYKAYRYADRQFGFPPSAGPLTPTDPNFLLGVSTTPSPTFSSTDWSGLLLQTSVANGWFVQQWVNYAPRYAPLVRYVLTEHSNDFPVVPTEYWEAWLDGNNLMAQRVSIVAGTGTIVNPYNTCPTTPLVVGQNIPIGMVCIHVDEERIAIAKGDTIVIDGQAREVINTRRDNPVYPGLWVQTGQPFDFEGVESGKTIRILAKPDKNCRTTKSLGSRVSTPDCTYGKTISATYGTVTINYNTPTATFDLANLTSVKYGDVFSVVSHFTSNSNGAVTFSLDSGSSGCSVTADGLVTANAATTGTQKCIIRASQAGAGIYTASDPLQSSFSVQRRPLIIAADNIGKPYGDVFPRRLFTGLFSDQGLTHTDTGLVFGDRVSALQIISDGSAAAAAVSNTPYAIVASSATIAVLDLATGESKNKTSNYSITYVAGGLTVNPALLDITANNDSKTYGETKAYGAGSLGFATGPSQLKNGNTIASVTITDAANGGAATAAVSTYPLNPGSAIAGAGTNLSNYAIAYHSGSLNVTPFAVSITPDGGKSKTYGQTFAAFTGTVSPTTLPNGDAISVSFTSPGAAGSAGVGSYDIAGSHTFTKGAATNYSVTDATAIGGLTVNPLAVMIMPAGGKSKTYGDPFTAFTGAVSPAILPNGDVISVTYASGGATPTAPVGSYDIVSSHGFSAGSPSNYIVSDGIAASGLTVNRAPLTIIYNGGSQYSDPITTTPSVIGLKNMESVGTACTGTSTQSAPPTPASAPGTYAVSAIFSGLNCPNYSLISGPGSYVVAQEDSTLTYTSLRYFGMAGKQSAVNVALTYTLQDASVLLRHAAGYYDSDAGDMTKAVAAPIRITGQYSSSSGNLTNFTGSCTPTPVTAASGLTLGGLLGTVPATGTFACTVSLPANGTFTATASADPISYYRFTSGDTAVTLTTSNDDVGHMAGGGFQTSSYLSADGDGANDKYVDYAPLSTMLLPAIGTKLEYDFSAKSHKNASSLQGDMKVVVHSDCLAAGIAGTSYAPLPGRDGLCVYEIASTTLISMADRPATSSAGSDYGNIVGNAILNDVTWSRRPQPLLRGGTMQMEMYESRDSTADTVGIQVTDSQGKLWFSNNWNKATQNTVTTAAAPQVQGGGVKIH